MHDDDSDGEGPDGMQKMMKEGMDKMEKEDGSEGMMKGGM